MAHKEMANKRVGLKQSLDITIGQIEYRFHDWYIDTEILRDVAEGIVLDSYTHGAVDNNLNLLVPEKVLDDVMKLITPTDDELGWAEEYTVLKDNFDNLFDDSGKVNSIDGLTKKMYDTWKNNIVELVAHGMKKAVSPVTNRETNNGIDYVEATREVFMKLLELEPPTSNRNGISIEDEVSKNLDGSTSPEIFLSVLNWLKSSPGLGFQWYLYSGIFGAKERLANSTADQLGIGESDMNMIISKIEQNPELLIQVAPSIGHVITTYKTHGAKSAMLYLLELGEWAQQDLDGTMELPANLQSPVFFNYLEKKILRHTSNRDIDHIDGSPLEIVFDKFPKLRDIYNQRISSVASIDLLIKNGCVLPGYTYELIFKNPAVITKLIPCLESAFGYGQGKVAISILYTADSGQKAKLQGK